MPTSGAERTGTDGGRGSGGGFSFRTFLKEKLPDMDDREMRGAFLSAYCDGSGRFDADFSGTPRSVTALFVNQILCLCKALPEATGKASERQMLDFVIGSLAEVKASLP